MRERQVRPAHMPTDRPRMPPAPYSERPSLQVRELGLGAHELLRVGSLLANWRAHLASLFAARASEGCGGPTGAADAARRVSSELAELFGRCAARVPAEYDDEDEAEATRAARQLGAAAGALAPMSGRCALTLLPLRPEAPTDRRADELAEMMPPSASLGGRAYHVNCANLWLHAVETEMPAC